MCTVQCTSAELPTDASCLGTIRTATSAHYNMIVNSRQAHMVGNVLGVVCDRKCDMQHSTDLG